jgi:hypothetical protein
MSGRCVIIGSSLVLLLGREISAQPRWQLTIEQRVVLDEGPAEPIKDLRDFAVGNDRRLYVLENTVKQIHVYSSNGRYVNSFARSGSGPGELRDANGILAVPDGTLWVNDHGNGRVNIYSLAGIWRRQFSSNAGGWGYTWRAFVDSSNVVHDEMLSAGQEAFERRRPDGKVIDTLKPPLCPGAGAARKTSFRARSKNGVGMVTTIPFMQRTLVAYDPRGAKWCISGDEYRIVRLDLRSGNVVGVAARSVKRHPVPQAVRDAAIARIRNAVAKYETSDADVSLMPNEYPYVGALVVDDHARLWAQRPEADGTRTTFDVFDERGTYLASATLAARINGYLRVIVRGDTLYAVALDSDDIPSVVRAQIRHSPGR